MARKVFIHIGLPKTGTTYLQTLLWNNRDALRQQGLLLPGRNSRQHMWASAVVREDPHLHRRGPAALRSWDGLVKRVNDWSGTALINHEFFAGASAEQAAAAIARFEGAEVHLVVTARDMLTLVTGYWQEFVKHGFEATLDHFPELDSEEAADEWGWSTLDIGGVLGRWGRTVKPERVHVLVVPPSSAPRERLWHEYAGLLGIDSSALDLSGSRRNESLGVVEVELLRRINDQIELRGDLRSALDRGVWRRDYLALGKLVPRGGDRYWPSESRVAEIRDRGNRAVTMIREQGFDVIGDLALLAVPEELPERRHPDRVTDEEMLEAATATIASMLSDVRSLHDENKRLEELVEVRSRRLGRRLRIRGRIRLRERLSRVRSRVWPRS